MDEFELRRTIYDYIREICHYSQIQVFSTSTYQRNYFQMMIDDSMNGLINFLLERDEITKQQILLAREVEMMRQEEEASGYKEQLKKQEYPQEQTNLENPENIEESGYIEEAGTLENQINNENPENVGYQQLQEELRVFTRDELAQNDGSMGRNAYVAVNGNVYDVTLATRWGGGTHFGLYAGHDLTDEFDACHNAMYEILRILPIIGTLQS